MVLRLIATRHLCMQCVTICLILIGLNQPMSILQIGALKCSNSALNTVSCLVVYLLFYSIKFKRSTQLSTTFWLLRKSRSVTCVLIILWCDAVLSIVTPIIKRHTVFIGIAMRKLTFVAETIQSYDK